MCGAIFCFVAEVEAHCRSDPWGQEIGPPPTVVSKVVLSKTWRVKCLCSKRCEVIARDGKRCSVALGGKNISISTLGIFPTPRSHPLSCQHPKNISPVVPRKISYQQNPLKYMPHRQQPGIKRLTCNAPYRSIRCCASFFAGFERT